MTNLNQLQNLKNTLDREVKTGNVDASSVIDIIRQYKDATNNEDTTTLTIFNDYIQGNINIWELGDALEILA